MHNQVYIDRGIIKWAPFDALVGYHSILGQMRYRMGKSDQPILSDDQYQELNEKLQFAFQFNLEIDVTYFHDGYARTTFGKIKKLDFVHQQIILTSFERIHSNQILEINITE
jgi:hypothetical protein